METNLLSMDEVAEVLHVKKRTAREFVLKNLPYIRVSRKIILMPKEVLEEFLKSSYRVSRYVSTKSDEGIEN